MADFPWDGGCWDRGKRSYLCSYDWWMCSSWSTAQSIWCLWDHDLKGILLVSAYLCHCTLSAFQQYVKFDWWARKYIVSACKPTSLCPWNTCMELLLCDFQAHCLHLGFHLVESNTELWPGKWILKTALRHISFHVQNVKPDRVIFNTLINACGRAGAVERAFDVLSDMKAEATPVKPDHVTYGALIAACARGGQVRSLFIHKGAALQRVPQAQEGVCASVASEWVGEWDQYCQGQIRVTE